MIVKTNKLFSIKAIKESSFDKFLRNIDHVYCIHFLPYEERLNNLKLEFDRVGLNYNSKKFTWQYTVPNKYYDLLFYGNQDFLNPVSVNITNINYTVNSYNMLKIAYEHGYERILVLEDDIRFLKNLEILDSYLLNVPLDYDLVLFEYFLWNQEKDVIKVYLQLFQNRINDYFLSFQKETLFDTGMLMLSRKMIKHIIDGCEKKLEPFDGYTRWLNTPNDIKLKRSISKVPLCILNIYQNRQENMEFLDKYQMIDRRDYNV